MMDYLMLLVSRVFINSSRRSYSPKCRPGIL